MTRVSRVLEEDGRFDRRSAREMAGARVAGVVVWDRYHIFCQDEGGRGRYPDTRKKKITIVTQNSRTADVDVAYCNSKFSQEQ